MMFVAIHPGWVKTDMGSSAAPMSTYDSVAAMLSLTRKLDKSHNGKFLLHDGSFLPW